MKVLIIDDEPHIRQMMRLTLEASGFEVDEAGSGEQGLEAFADGRGYALVVLDQKMPGIDGLGTLKQLKERTPDANVLMVTAFASVELAVDAMKLGATDFLRKPMTPEMLRGAVAAATAADRRPPVPRPAAGAGRVSEIQTLTLNGFQITSAHIATTGVGANEHAFIVRHFANRSERTVIVAIDPEASDRVRRLTGRQLEPQGAFFRLQAERLLSAYLWSEGKPPDNGRLTVRDVSRDDLDTAMAWAAD
jgi:DNA-binding response OmpR family regulator